MSKNINNTKWRREDIKIGSWPLSKIPGLYRSEDHPMEEAQQKLAQETKDQYSHEEVFGDYCNVNQYINCPVDEAVAYASNPYSLEEWTFSVRDLKEVGGGLLCGREALANNTVIYVRTEVYTDARAVDYLCAWDQGQELWMRYYCRFIDAMPAINKPGSILMWLNCRHPHYLRGQQGAPKHIVDGQARQDRPWVGDIWKFFKVGHEIEAANLKQILEHRFGKGK